MAAAVSERVRLGSYVRDSITGFAGVATARTEYVYDAPSVRVTAVDTWQDDLRERWVTEARLVVVDGERPPGFAR
jgi:hypothetical protein